MNKNRYYLIERLKSLGFTFDECNQLRRIEMALTRWSELECGTGDDRVSRSVERDETTGKPFMRFQYNAGSGWVDTKYPIADKEKGALNRLSKIMERHPDLIHYNQGDCRGCALYIVRKSDLKPGEVLDQVYNRGVAVCD